MAKKPARQKYENNPFFIATSGITLFANMANGVFVVLLALSVFGLFTRSSVPEPTKESVNDTVAMISTWSLNDWMLALGAGFIIGLAVAMVLALLGGVSSYTSAQLARGKKAPLHTAFSQAFEHLWSYLWLQLLILIKVLLWSLLFVIPGIIMAIRYSLAGVAFYDEQKNLRGNAAIKESLRLTRGGWITTYAGTALFSFLTLGAINSIVATGANAVLYRQFEQVGNKKPEAHWLSWLTLILPFATLGALLLLAISIALATNSLDMLIP